MNKLLNRLKQVDPTTYENIADCLAWAEVQWEELYPKYKGDKPYIPEDAEISAPMEYLIQGVLQDAISGEGWIYRIDAYPDECIAVIRFTKETENRSDTSCIYMRAGNPVRALLAVYIAACEAIHDV